MKLNGRKVNRNAFVDRMEAIYETHLVEYWQQGKDLIALTGKSGDYPDTLTYDEFVDVCTWLQLPEYEINAGRHRSFRNSMIFASTVDRLTAKKLRLRNMSRHSVSRICSRIRNARERRKFFDNIIDGKVASGGRRLTLELDSLNPSKVRLPSSRKNRIESFLSKAVKTARYNDALAYQENFETWDVTACEQVSEAAQDAIESQCEVLGRLLGDKKLSAKVMGEIYAALDDHNTKRRNGKLKLAAS